MMNSPRSAFATALAQAAVPESGRRWFYVPYDQLTDQVGPLSREPPNGVGIVLVESRQKAARRPYHKQKLALVLSNQRHFALEQARRGVAVRYLAGADGYAEQLRKVIGDLGPITMMRAAERELRVELQPLVDEGLIRVVPHEGWMTPPEWFQEIFTGGKSWKMDIFYRHVRRKTGVLMRGNDPVGERFSFDFENRSPWPGTPLAPPVPTFTVDAITEEVGRLVQLHFSNHPGKLELGTIPATQADAAALWSWAKSACLRHFGPYQDAMSKDERNLFHTRLSAVIHLGRLLPAALVREAEALDVPLESKEGFIRQILGWREFMHHVHDATDGFRQLGGPTTSEATSDGDAGYGRWHDWQPVAQSGSAANHLSANLPLPEAFWGKRSGMACLDSVVEDVWEEGQSHHITRLMVLSNIATLLGVSPRELTDWFWVAYTDAYDWVVEPNVLGMGTFALGDLFTTKPYVSGATYLDRMSDYCDGCAFSPKKDCPMTPMYWAFLDRNQPVLGANPRLVMPYASLRRRAAALRQRDAEVHRWVTDTLREGKALDPADAPAVVSAKKAAR